MALNMVTKVPYGITDPEALQHIRMSNRRKFALEVYNSILAIEGYAAIKVTETVRPGHDDFGIYPATDILYEAEIEKVNTIPVHFYEFRLQEIRTPSWREIGKIIWNKMASRK